MARIQRMDLTRVVEKLGSKEGCGKESDRFYTQRAEPTSHAALVQRRLARADRKTPSLATIPRRTRRLSGATVAFRQTWPWFALCSAALGCWENLTVKTNTFGQKTEPSQAECSTPRHSLRSSRRFHVSYPCARRTTMNENVAQAAGLPLWRRNPPDCGTGLFSSQHCHINPW